MAPSIHTIPRMFPALGAFPFLILVCIMSGNGQTARMLDLWAYHHPFCTYIPCAIRQGV